MKDIIFTCDPSHTKANYFYPVIYHKMKIAFSLLVGAILLVVPIQGLVSSESYSQVIPDGFKEIASSTGVSVYEKNYPGGNPDYVQVVDLSQGASIVLLHGKISDPGKGKGVYGGDNPLFMRDSLQNTWEDYSSTNPNGFCIMNGQFFSTNENPTSIAFPLKKDGTIVSDGYGIDEFLNQKLMLEIWTDRVDIQPLSEDALYSSSAPNIIAGLTEDADKGPVNNVGRTFMGVSDQNSDGRYETILVFNSKTSTQTNAIEMLRSFGAGKVIMLDGGSSTQLICRGQHYIESSRTIPQTMVVIQGRVKPPSPIDIPGFWEKLRQQISDWVRQELAKVEKLVKDWLIEKEREVLKWLETQLKDYLSQLCNIGWVPAGLAIVWVYKRKSK